MAFVAANYFVTVRELTIHNTASAQEKTIEPSPSPLAKTLVPLIPYTPFVLAALLFVVAFAILVVNRVRNLKNVTTAFVLALMVASMPMMLTYIGQGSRQEVKAGPEEIPRNVRVAPVSPTSVRIFWETDGPAVGVVRLSKTPLTLPAARVFIADDQASTREHSIIIDRLLRNQSYEFEIMSGTAWYDNNGAYIQFTVP